ncbi:probable low-specificity L-threonine aldolase 2 [Notolabrus celidotus]|uniref:probable low-specificity L-threonine aldolase 2 n=1 Tax=Notolabrus celidotus TaxID=1203425 RepID=UPI001490664C|nr:probable low-specificity L-threonine aldolase 2 [Notolabrus celidotus]
MIIDCERTRSKFNTNNIIEHSFWSCIMSLKTLSRGVLFKLFKHSVSSSEKSFRAGQPAAAAAVQGRSSMRWYYNNPVKDGYPATGQAAHVQVVDLRSDTVTKPGPAMRQAMAEAEVGDDVMGEDPTVNELQNIAADMFGMEAALFVPTGTMSNLIAVMVHCRERGDEMIVGDLSHLHIYEQGGSAQLAGVHATTVTTLPDGTFDLDQMESKIRHGYPDPHYPRSRLVCVENTHNIQGGRVLPLTFLQKVRAMADKYGLLVHMDGARLMNAAVAQGVPPSTILQHTHTVSVCLSKGLGAPVGTMLAGPKDFISRALRCRKALGGGMRQAGVLAAAGKLSLLEMVGRLEEDHHNARTFAQALLNCDPPLFDVDLTTVETNILRFRLQEPSLSPPEFCARMGQVGDGEEAALGQGIKVLMYPHYSNSVRAVWHLGISPEDTQLAIRKMQFVASQYLKEKLRAQ